MTINLIKEDMKTSEIICQKYSQTMVENDVIVPDIKPDIKKVLEISGNVCITQRAIQQDKVFIQGIVRMTVLYLPDVDASGNLKSLFVSQEFSHLIDCRGANPDMQLYVDANIESFDHTLINSRKVSLRCMVSLAVKVSRPITLSLTTGTQDSDSIALKRERLRLMGGTECCECQIILREQLEIPSGKPTIGEILKLTPFPSSTELCIMDGKAVAKGQVKVCTLYNCEEDGSLQFMEHILPFTEILDINGATEGMDGDIEYSINDMYYEIRDDADGEARGLGLELVLGANVKGSEVTEIEAVTDAYSLNGGLELDTKAYHMEQLLDKSTAELPHKAQAQLPPMLPRLKQVCDVNADAKIERISVDNGQITAFGLVRTNILYMTTDDAMPIASFNHVSEFSQSFNIAGADNNTVCDAQVFLDNVSYTLSGDDSLELRFTIGISIKALKTGDTVLVEAMNPFIPEDGKPHSCIFLYFVEKGDTLWNIAKTYHTTVDSIRQLNNIDGDLIYPGQQLKIISGR